MPTATLADCKNLTWVWGANRKFRPQGHCLASRGFAEWYKTVITRDGIFYPHRTLMFDSFSCISFHFECFILKVALYYHTQWRWRRTFWNLSSQERQPNDKVAWRSIQPMQTEYSWKVSFCGEMTCVRISIPSEDLGFPYPVCKNNMYTKDILQ